MVMEPVPAANTVVHITIIRAAIKITDKIFLAVFIWSSSFNKFFVGSIPWHII